MVHHLVCIALRDAPGYDCAKLHAAMAHQGFLPTYQGTNATYRLPAGLYHKHSAQKATDVLDSVRQAVRQALQDESTLVKAQNHFPAIVVSELKALDGLPTLKAHRKKH